MLPTVPYHPTPFEKAREMLKLAGLKEGECLYDLGCGEANILIVGAEEFGATCVGIEKDASLVRAARRKIKERGLENKITIIEGDIFSDIFWSYRGRGDKPYAISKADVVAMYLNFNMHEVIVPMLEKELRECVRVVSYEFFIRGWKSVRELPMIFVFEKGKSF